MEWLHFFFVVVPIVTIGVSAVVGAVAWCLSAESEGGFAVRFILMLAVIVAVIGLGDWIQHG